MGPLGTEGRGGDGQASPIQPEQEGEGPAGIRRGVGLGLEAEFLTGRRRLGQGLRPLLGTFAARRSVSSKQEKSWGKNAHVRELVFAGTALPGARA